ncbi:MAG: choice-of-anchor B family protein [Fimbriimonadaceae bacterium]|nr:choice-of-anchor B family protein [Fimbriimonadaceae bacterium]QYK55166.1 MAG: choice-of-anchor B family protein [Fimbriimonadaceae bacterium]
MAPTRLFLLLATLAVSAGSALAQYQFDKIRLIRQFTLSELQAGSGNTCWGYVSPSGREYVLMGTDRNTTIVEVTNNENPTIVTRVAHSSGGIWSDIKTYRNAMYVGTENSGSGIQVIDLSNIDNGVATLVRTISNPGRTHTLHVDQTSGFLYACGANEGSGTTMCWDLTNPLNPVRVGQNSLTNVYQHETQVHTYTSGRYAGKQIFFGGGEGRGLEIWDVTNKNAVTLIRRVSYPFVGYCHQGWLSPDLKYFYVNDEFDESNGLPTVRTLVFDVSVLETADLVATYSNNRPTIDHNLYNKNNFIFHSNYTSGFWIFDANDNPLNPRLCGFFDTYPNGDPKQYAGSWGNYPFLPSGVCAISDMQRGLFIVDVTEATQVKRDTTAFRIFRGRNVGGDLPDLLVEDGNVLRIGKGVVPNQSEPPINVEFDADGRWEDISRLRVTVRHSVSTSGLTQAIEAFDWVANSWVTLQTGPAPTTPTTLTAIAPNPDRFVQAGNKTVRTRLTVKQTGPTSASDWTSSIDLANVTINP